MQSVLCDFKLNTATRKCRICVCVFLESFLDLRLAFGRKSKRNVCYVPVLSKAIRHDHIVHIITMYVQWKEICKIVTQRIAVQKGVIYVS